jgi:hypothetical protein
MQRMLPIIEDKEMVLQFSELESILTNAKLDNTPMGKHHNPLYLMVSEWKQL